MSILPSTGISAKDIPPPLAWQSTKKCATNRGLSHEFFPECPLDASPVAHLKPTATGNGTSEIAAAIAPPHILIHPSVHRVALHHSADVVAFDFDFQPFSAWPASPLFASGCSLGRSRESIKPPPPKKSSKILPAFRRRLQSISGRRMRASQRPAPGYQQQFSAHAPHHSPLTTHHSPLTTHHSNTTKPLMKEIYPKVVDGE